MSPTVVRELTRALAAGVAVAVLQPWLVQWVGPFSERPERALAVLVPLAIVLLVLGRPIARDRRVLLGGGFLAFFIAFCLLFALAAGSDLLSGRRTPLLGYEQDVPSNFLGLNRLGDWRYALLPQQSRGGTAIVVFTLEDRAAPEDLRRQFAFLVRQAVQERARGIAFDYYFDDPSPVDPLLCAEVGRATAQGLPVFFGYRHEERDGFLVAVSPPESLACLRDHLASLAGYREADNRVRMVPLFFQHDRGAESLGLRIARTLVTGDLPLPERDLVQFTRPQPDPDPLPWSPGNQHAELFERRFVLVGSSRGGDVHDTPFGRLPGVKIHQLAAYSLSQGRFIERLGARWTFPLIFALCFVLSVAQAQGAGPRRLAVLAFALLGSTVLLAAAAMRSALLWIDVSYAFAAVGSLTALLLAGSVVQARRREREQIVRAAAGTASADAQAVRRILDVFLSHNGRDKPAVRDLAEALRARGLEVWLDEWELVPGRPWQEAIEEAIVTARTAAVLVGPDGLGPWEAPEMRVCLEQAVRRSMPVIPVLLPGASDTPSLPPFLERFTWVDLRRGVDDAALDRLEWGITGVKPRRSPRVNAR